VGSSIYSPFNPCQSMTFLTKGHVVTFVIVVVAVVVAVTVAIPKLSQLKNK